MTDQPDMQQSDHPEHNMPATSAGTRGTMGRGASISDAADRGAKRSPSTEAMPTDGGVTLDRGAWD